jgi:hypothetical protein
MLGLFRRHFQCHIPGLQVNKLGLITGYSDHVARATVDTVTGSGRVWAVLSELHPQTGLVPVLLGGRTGWMSLPCWRTGGAVRYGRMWTTPRRWCSGHRSPWSGPAWPMGVRLTLHDEGTENRMVTSASAVFEVV